MTEQTPRGVSVDTLELPGWLLVTALALGAWSGLAVGGVLAPLCGLVLAVSAALALQRLGLAQLRTERLRAALPGLLASFAVAALVLLSLLGNTRNDCGCHQGYLLSVLRGAVPPPELHDISAASTYHWGFELIAAGLQQLFDAAQVEMSLDLTSALVLFLAGLAATSLLGRLGAPPLVRAAGVLTLLLGLGPLWLTALGAGPAESLAPWHGGTFMSPAELAGRRPSAIGLLVLLLGLNRLAAGDLALEALRDRRRVWGLAALAFVLTGAALLSAEEMLPLLAVTVVAGAGAGSAGADGRRAVLRLWPVVLAVFAALPLAWLAGGFLRAALGGAPGLGVGLTLPGLPSFVHGRVHPWQGTYWLVLLLELGPAAAALPLLQRAGATRSYTWGVLALSLAGLVLAHTLTLGGYDTDVHRLAVPVGWLALLHAPFVTWALLRRRPFLAAAGVVTLLAVSLPSPVGYLLSGAPEGGLLGGALRPLVAGQSWWIAPLLVAPLLVAALWRFRRVAVGRRVAIPILIVAVLTLPGWLYHLARFLHGPGYERWSRPAETPWAVGTCRGDDVYDDEYEQLAECAARDRDAIRYPTLAVAPLADALMARGLPVIAAVKVPEHGRVDRHAHEQLLRRWPRRGPDDGARRPTIAPNWPFPGWYLLSEARAATIRWSAPGRHPYRMLASSRLPQGLELGLFGSAAAGMADELSQGHPCPGPPFARGPAPSPFPTVLAFLACVLAAAIPTLLGRLRPGILLRAP